MSSTPEPQRRSRVPAAGDHQRLRQHLCGDSRLVESARADQAPFVRAADWYAVAFVGFSLVLAAVAGLVSGDPVRAVAVLVVATPCPLILAAPVAIVSGMARCASRGVVVKDGAALERLGGATVLLFDKTGTITRGAPTVACDRRSRCRDGRSRRHRVVRGRRRPLDGRSA